jgi:tRNA pseudouridine55 synthase
LTSDAPFGFLNIDKPRGITSHDVVARLRRVTGTRKVGHAGTLDPMATGVLVLCLGAATRLSEYVMASTKRYRAQVLLGVETDSYDADGQVIANADASHLTRADLERALPQFVGDLQQLPPIYSAIKRDGKKLYELARAGQDVELEPRPVTIHALELVDWSGPSFTIDVTCSPGTYIRSLAHDLGAALGVGAHLTGLVRTASGYFTLDNAVSLATILDSAVWQPHVIPPQVALTDWPSLRVSAEQALALQQGKRIAGAASGRIVMAYRDDDSLAAVLERRGDSWHPLKVFVC